MITCRPISSAVTPSERRSESVLVPIQRRPSARSAITNAEEGSVPASTRPSWRYVTVVVVSAAGVHGSLDCVVNIVAGKAIPLLEESCWDTATSGKGERRVRAEQRCADL